MNEKIIIAALGGSRLFGLETDTSDEDYFIMVFPDDSLVLGEEKEVHKETVDYFVHRIDTMYELEACASPLVVPTYGSAVYGNGDMIRFWNENAERLANISPATTYNNAIGYARKIIDEKSVKALKICSRLIGMMWCRYYTGDMLSARYLPEKWRSRYFAAKNGEAGIEDVKGWLDEIRTPSIQRYFSLEPINYELHNEYCQLINSILEESNNE